jgi:hypothetical protein
MKCKKLRESFVGVKPNSAAKLASRQLLSKSVSGNEGRESKCPPPNSAQTAFICFTNSAKR